MGAGAIAQCLQQDEPGVVIVGVTGVLWGYQFAFAPISWDTGANPEVMSHPLIGYLKWMLMTGLEFDQPDDVCQHHSGVDVGGDRG